MVTAGSAWRGAEGCVTAGHHRPGGSGDSRLASAATPVRASAREGAALADAPGADSPPTFSADAIGLMVLPVSVHAFPLGHFAPFRAGPGRNPARLACRRRALETVEKAFSSR
jgi:hypothetical protein